MKQILSLLVVLLLAVATLSAQNPPEYRTVTITGGESISTAASLQSCTVAAIIVDSAWTAAKISPVASVDGTNYHAVYDQYDAMVAYSAAASRWIQLQLGDSWGYRYVKLASVNTGTGAAEAQAATRTLKIICRK